MVVDLQIPQYLVDILDIVHQDMVLLIQVEEEQVHTLKLLEIILWVMLVHQVDQVKWLLHIPQINHWEKLK